MATFLENRIAKRTIGLVSFSALFHVLLFGLLPNQVFNSEAKISSATKIKFSESTKIISAKSSSKPQVVNKAQVKLNSESDVAKKNHTDQSESIAQSDSAKSIYHKLMPQPSQALSADNQESAMQNTNEQSHSAKISIGRSYGLVGDRLGPKEDYQLDQLASKIIIPHVWREKADESHAVAMIRRDEKSNLWLDSLHGDPLLRAVLYQNLLRNDFLNSLDVELTAADIKEFKIVLRFVSQNDSYRGLNTEISAFRDGLVVTKSLPPVMRIFKGIPVSDEYAERAKKREHLEIEKLMELPAFHHRIERVLLKAG